MPLFSKTFVVFYIYGMLSKNIPFISPGRRQTLFFYKYFISKKYSHGDVRHSRLKIIDVWSQMLIKPSTLSDREHIIFICVSVFPSVCLCSRALFFCFVGIWPSSTIFNPKRESCRKTTENIKWNNTWKFNRTETFDRKQRNCTRIEQEVPVLAFTIYYPLSGWCFICWCTHLQQNETINRLL